MKILFFLGLNFTLLACVHPGRADSNKTEFHCEVAPQEFALSLSTISGKAESFLPHVGDKKFENYLSLNLPFAPFSQLNSDIQNQFGNLKNRGEVHITVITPPEFDAILSQKLSMKEINAIAENFKIQDSEVKAVCLGRGDAVLAGIKQSTYFVVLESQSLVELRRQISSAYLAKGGKPHEFDPENYYPHITIGFSLRDLHESDGVKKDKNTCIAQLLLINK